MQEGIFFIQNAFTLRSQLQLGEQNTNYSNCTELIVTGHESVATGHIASAVDPSNLDRKLFVINSILLVRMHSV